MPRPFPPPPRSACRAVSWTYENSEAIGLASSRAGVDSARSAAGPAGAARHVIVVAQRFPFPAAGIQVEDAPGVLGTIRVPAGRSSTESARERLMAAASSTRPTVLRLIGRLWE